MSTATEKPGDDLYHTYKKTTTGRFVRVTEENILVLARRFEATVRYDGEMAVLVMPKSSTRYVEFEHRVGTFLDERGRSEIDYGWELWE